MRRFVMFVTAVCLLFLLKSKHKSVFSLLCWVIEQVCGQDGWILAKKTFLVVRNRDTVDVQKRVKRLPGQILRK